MPGPLEPEAQRAALECMFGSQRSSRAPAQVELALYDGMPGEDGVAELPEVGGYAAQVLDNDDDLWAETGPEDRALTSVDIVWTPTGTWPTDALWWALRDASTGFVWACARLSEPIDVDADNGTVSPFTTRMVIPWSQEF